MSSSNSKQRFIARVRQMKVARISGAILVCALMAQKPLADETWEQIAPFFSPPAEFQNRFGPYKSLLQFDAGAPVTSPPDWPKRRQEILDRWHSLMGNWPPLLKDPKLEFLESSPQEHFIRHRVRLEIAPGQMIEGYLLAPIGQGPFPAVLIPYYEPDTSTGLGQQKLRDFGLQLARRGFVTLSIGSPGGDARKPALGQAECQPLSFLAYVAANCHSALAGLPDVDPARIGITGHSYGGKWAMFAACLYDKFACGVWSDPGIVFDEARPNVNYWEPWYLGRDPRQQRAPGVPSKDNPRTGAYKVLFEAGHDLHELLALMPPRPFLVSGGSEDPPERWLALNRVVEINDLLGTTNRVAMTNRPGHTPSVESNEQIYSFFEHFLKPAGSK
jgi:hypothetical protein